MSPCSLKAMPRAADKDLVSDATDPTRDALAFRFKLGHFYGVTEALALASRAADLTDLCDKLQTIADELEGPADDSAPPTSAELIAVVTRQLEAQGLSWEKLTDR